MRRRQVLSGVATAAAVSVAGCSSDGDDGDATGGNRPVVADDASTGAQSAQSLRMTIGDAVAGTEWPAFAAAYPRDRFVVDSTQHDQLQLGVDTTGDGTFDETFDESHVSGANNNDFSFDLLLEIGYELAAGDEVVVGSPAVRNPDNPGDYEVSLSLNDEQTAMGTLRIE